jgi:hypothetical protein
MQASAWLPGYLIGPFRYEGTRDDDPSDVIPHEDRRELRGARVLAAWVDHFDSREQNTMDSWIAAADHPPESSPGFVRHYYLDTSDCFGSEWAWDGISRRLGRSYLLDWGDLSADFATLGLVSRPWDRVRRTKGFELFGYYSDREFDPEGWKNEYPNPAFSRATEQDNAWMARILAQFTREDIAALVSLGHFSRPRVSAYLTEILERRLRLILERYLLRLSPITSVSVSAGGRLCGTDLARRRKVRADSAFRYTAAWRSDGRERALAVTAEPDGAVCVALPNGEAAEYATVMLGNAAARFPLRIHLRRPSREEPYRVVGLERLEE